jgi:glycosyltransferase involved in cell wall biosynthesis
MEQPLVAILVPVYHVEDYIERCARSVFEQTYNNLEFIFVDDGSDDLSMDILNRVSSYYPKRLEHVRIIRHHQNKGLAAARNTAVSACRGEFVFHVDSDDWVETNAVELLVKKQQETDADIVTAEAIDIDNGKKKKHLSGGWNLDKEALLVGLLTYQISTVLWRRLIRKRLYTDNNISCDEHGSGGEDFQVLPRLVYYANKVSGIEDCIYYYNKSNQRSITNSAKNNLEIQIQGLASVKVIVSFFSDKEQYLSKIVAGMDVKNIHFRLVNNAVYRNKMGYDVFLKYMKTLDPKFWHLVGWDKPLVRCLESNYYSILLLQKYLHIQHKIFRRIISR